MEIIASREEVQKFLDENQFSGYQKVPLPHDQYVPGKDRSERVDYILGDRVEGKTLLDVGTNYGLFPLMALDRGAVKAVGLEADSERYKIASLISNLHGNRYEIIHGDANDELQFEHPFDVVLLLNVLHHVKDPINTVLQLAKICSETMVVEFSLADDSAYIDHCYPKWVRSVTPFRAAARVHSFLLRTLAGGLPLMAVGNVEYHRTFFFNPRAFYNLFVVHHRVFESIEFQRSRFGASRRLAICQIRRGE